MTDRRHEGSCVPAGDQNPMQMELSADGILGPEGRLADRLAPNYEIREQQMRMAAAVAEAFAKGQHLLVEAGTGTGKSFGYLVPAILHATDPLSEGGGRRVVISTHTISLQEQLMGKDLPLLNSVIPREFSAVLVKGRANYLSLRRLANTTERSTNLFQDPQDAEQLSRIGRWASETTDGTQSDLPFRPMTAVWDEVVSDSGNCMGRSCGTYETCFYYKARRRAQHAQILVVNHALFFSDLALRQRGVSVIPDYDAVIFDEAHTLEDAASSHLGLRLTNGAVDYNLRRLFNDRTNKGLLVDGQGGNRRAQQQVDHCRTASDTLFSELHYWYEAQPSGFNGRVDTPRVIKNNLSPQLVELAGLVKTSAKRLDEDSKRKDLLAAADRVLALADLLESWLSQTISENVYWVSRSFDRRGIPRFELAAAPLEVGTVLREQLFQAVPSVVMTSATLASGKDDFGFIQSRVGLTHSNTLQVGSPFDYRRQVRLKLLDGMPDPSREPQAYERLTASMIEYFTRQTDGHAFALFTSYDLMRKVAARIAPGLRSADIGLLSQADGTPRSLLLDRFRREPRSLLMGADSFWQGVDVPGETLQNVMITKLPFSVPDQPLRQARMEAIQAAGGNAFVDFQLPEAVIKFRQGFGRLIRTSRDAGMVVVFDPRVRTKPYGQRFLDGLPECEIEHVPVTDLET